MQLGDQMKQSVVQNLTPEEVAELDSLIDRRTAELCTKAFGPEVARLFEPFIKNDPVTGQGIQHMAGSAFRGNQ